MLERGEGGRERERQRETETEREMYDLYEEEFLLLSRGDGVPQGAHLLQDGLRLLGGETLRTAGHLQVYPRREDITALTLATNTYY